MAVRKAVVKGFLFALLSCEKEAELQLRKSETPGVARGNFTVSASGQENDLDFPLKAQVTVSEALLCSPPHTL